MIEIKNLSVTYKTKEGSFLALDGINIDIEPGDICAVIGPSGCGKSTLLYVLSGIIRNYAGSVLIDGAPVNPRRQRIGLVLQNYGLLPWKNVYSNSVLGLKINGANITGEKNYIEYILKQLGLSELKSRYPNQLSGGERQRVAIARSFILKPDILLMDEPFSALDAITREEIQDLFLKIWSKNRVSTVFVTHSIEEALYLGRRIVILSPSPGRIVRILDNPVFGLVNSRLRDEFYRLTVELRKIVKKEWSR